MYFHDRAQAGQLLARELTKYRFENTIVVALSDGGVLVGEQIATQLHCLLTMLLTKEIELPGEDISIGSVDQNGGFIYNDMFSAGQIEEYETEFRNNIEADKLTKMHEMNEILGQGGLLTRDMLLDRVIILVTDGLKSGMSLVAAVNFLKSIRTQKIVVATPLASVAAVDKMHVLSDEIHVLSVIDSAFEVDHYYEENPSLDHQAIIKKLNEIILQWH
jgi:predicted phosphoribosyltransferase